MFYVYKVIDVETKEYYIGSRKYKGDDPTKDKYLGSPYIWKPNISNLEKFILKCDFKNMTEAISYERNLIISEIDNPLNRNYSIPYERFHRSNLITCINSKGKIVTLHKDDPLFGIEFFGVTKGKVLVREADKVFYVDKDDHRYLSGELKHNNKFVMPKGKEHPNWGKIQINNGEDQKLIYPEDFEFYSDNGWLLGTLQKNKKTISSHYDRIWITNGSLNKRIEEDDLDNYLNDNWWKGRTLGKYKKRKK